MPATPVIISLTRPSAPLADKLARGLGGAWHQFAKTGTAANDARQSKDDNASPAATFSDAMAHIRQQFLAGHPIIGICAAAILIRALAPVLGNKHTSPPVIAVSADGKHIVPLLGTHHGDAGGGNGGKIAETCAKICAGSIAHTTASDTLFGIALDAPPPPFVLADSNQAKAAMAALIDGAQPRLACDLPDSLAVVAAAWRDWLQPLLAASKGGDPAKQINLLLTLRPVVAPQTLVFHPRLIGLGVGAARNCPPEEMADLLATSLASHNISRHTIGGIYSVAQKMDEAAILCLADELGLRPRFFSPARLEAETPRLANPSATVYAEIGSHGVAEAAALAATGKHGWLMLPKQKSKMATLALAISATGVTDEDSVPRGRLLLVGIGPGGEAWRTAEAMAWLAEADELVGYRLYLDLLGEVAGDKPRADFGLGEEVARCRYAIDSAATGKTVALVCSGDAGVYGMAALVYEMLAGKKIATSIDIASTPGIPAHIAAAAKCGAVLGHDHAIISLSDLLTPWAVIEARLQAAAEADFVIALYNPVSRQRQQGLAKARAILLSHRPPTTPVVLARNMGRADESIRHRTLATLTAAEVDMLTVVLVGARDSTRVSLANSQAVYTPRGYASKKETSK